MFRQQAKPTIWLPLTPVTRRGSCFPDLADKGTHPQAGPGRVDIIFSKGPRFFEGLKVAPPVPCRPVPLLLYEGSPSQYREPSDRLGGFGIGAAVRGPAKPAAKRRV